MGKKELGLVDDLIFEAYKDKVLKNSNEFKKTIRLNYGLIPSSDLYRRIINYQVKRYGKQLDISLRDYVEHFELKSNKQRRNGMNRIEERRQQRKFEERVENEKR